MVDDPSDSAIGAPAPPTGLPTFAVETSGLVKTFGRTRAVDGVDLAVRTGTVYGVLGPNGAGKTTTVSSSTSPPPGSTRAAGTRCGSSTTGG